MSETRFTPGPWHVVYIGGGDYEAHNAEGLDVFSAGDVGEAAGPNHHLAAAAPDLYEALRALCYAETGFREREALYASAKAALAKANGPGEHGTPQASDTEVG